jgi:hypothetical protein
MPAGRPKKAIRPVKKTLTLPEDLVAQVELRLFSDLEGRVPTGAWQSLVIELLGQWLKGNSHG